MRRSFEDNSTQIRLYAADKLPCEHVAAWTEIQESAPALDSPYLRPEFVQAVSAVRPDVEVAVYEEDGRGVAFFPFQRTSRHAALPAGAPLSDCQAVIAPPNFECDPRRLLKACRLSSWRFDHLIDSQPAFRHFARRKADAAHVDLSGGFETYATGLRNRRRYLAAESRKQRRLAEEFGPIRFVTHTADNELLTTLIRWKCEQYRRTRVRNVFSATWTVRLLHKLLEHRSDRFAPLLSALYVGDRIASIHYGLRSGNVLHSWFPAYDRELSRYSPGILLFLQLFKSAESLGIQRVDMSTGFGIHKHRYMSGSSYVLEGTVDTRATIALARRACDKAQLWLRKSAAYPHLRNTARTLGGLISWRTTPSTTGD